MYDIKKNINVFLTPSQITISQINSNYHFRLGGMVKKNSVERKQQSDNKINNDKQKIYKNRIIMRKRPRRGQTKTAGAFKHDWYAWTRPEAQYYARSRRRNKNNVERWNSTITTLCTRERFPCKNPCSNGIKPRPRGPNQFALSLCGLVCQGPRW